MIASAAFVIAFVVLGLGVVFVAMGGGARGTREAMHRQSRTGRKFAFTTIGIVILAFGIAIPAVVLAVNAKRESKRTAGGLTLNAAQQRGRHLFAKNCATCHTLDASNSAGKVGPNLDQLRPPSGLVLDAIKNGRARGNGQMPALLLDGQDAKDVAAFVAKVAGR